MTNNDTPSVSAEPVSAERLDELIRWATTAAETIPICHPSGNTDDPLRITRGKWIDASNALRTVAALREQVARMTPVHNLSSAPWRVVEGKENVGHGWPVAFMGEDHNSVAWYIETHGVRASEAFSDPQADAIAIVKWRNALADTARAGGEV